jgi:DNA-3-methyladenine glycosylase II
MNHTPLLNDDTLIEGADYIADRDPEMAAVLKQYGYPPLWARAPGFIALAKLILEQQVSLASAKAAYQRLSEVLGHEVTPQNFLSLDDLTLRNIGYSRQKTHYTRLLANAIEEGFFVIEHLNDKPDEAVKTALKKLKGIGDWTADVYLSECLLRPDILPKGDIAMLEAIKVLKNLDQRPDHDTFIELTAHWRPWRSVGTRMLWHYYLSVRRKVPPQ